MGAGGTGSLSSLCQLRYPGSLLGFFGIEYSGVPAFQYNNSSLGFDPNPRSGDEGQGRGGAVALTIDPF